MFVIVDYGVGNLTSIQNMLKKGGVSAVISGQPDIVNQASKLLLPGMGHFDNCIQQLNASGLRPIIERKAFEERVPLLGICVGLQMLMESSEEGVEQGLGWIKGRVVRFNPAGMDSPHKIPNMGWLEVQSKKNSRLLTGLQDPRFYFAHSYHVVPDHKEDDLLEARYGYAFSAGLEQGNILGVQFHPEKSHRFGLQLLKNFSESY